MKLSKEREIVGDCDYVPLERRTRTSAPTFEANLERLGEHIHGPALGAMWCAAEDIVRSGKAGAHTSREVLVALLEPYVARLIEALRKTDRWHSDRPSVEREIAQLMQSGISAVTKVLALRNTRICEPRYKPVEVDLAEGERRLKTLLAVELAAAEEVYEQRLRQRLAISSWEFMGSPPPPNRLSFPYPFYTYALRHLVVRASFGLGKSTTLLRELMLRLSRFRYYMFVPTYKLAEQLQDRFMQLRDEIAARGEDVSAIPDPLIIRGRLEDGMCQADDARKAAAEAAGKQGVPVHQSVCDNCPHQTGCAYLEQFKQVGPGLKLAVTPFIGADAVPGLPRDEAARQKQLGQGAAPILGIAIDEGFGQALIRRDELPLSDLPSMGDVAVLSLDRRASTLWGSHTPGRLRDAITLVQRAIKNANAHGELSLEPFEPLYRHDLEDEDKRLHIEIVCDLLRRLLHEHGSAASEVINSALTEGTEPDYAGRTFTAHRQVKLLEHLFRLIRDADPRRSYLQCVRISDGKLIVHSQHRIPSAISYYPLIILDATAGDNVAIPFSHRKESGRGFERSCFLYIETIRASAPYATRVKLLNAPATAGKLTDPIHDSSSGEQLRRLRPDAKPEEFARFLSAILGRAGGGGVITYKKLHGYLEKSGALPANVIIDHFMNVRGRKDWENEPVLIVAGRPLPPLYACEDLAAAIYACDPDAREIIRGLSMIRRDRGVRLRHRDSIIGARASCEVHPCPNIQLVIEEHVLSDLMQALGRSRDVRRTAVNPVLVISISNFVEDETFDAVIDWSEVADLDVETALLHASGAVSETARVNRRLAPHLFGAVRPRKNERAKDPRALFTNEPHPFAAPAYRHPLLTPASPAAAEIALRSKCRHVTHVAAHLDRGRPDTGAAAIAKALGKTLVGWRWSEASADTNGNETLPGSPIQTTAEAPGLRLMQ